MKLDILYRISYIPLMVFYKFTHTDAHVSNMKADKRVQH